MKKSNQKTDGKSKKISKFAVIAGAALIGLASFLTYDYITERQETREAERLVEQKYIAEIHEFGNSGKRNVYIILQRHGLIRHNLGEIIKKEVNEDVAGIQVSIYRIVESLHKNKKLGVVACEGIDYTDYDDIKNPISLMNKLQLEKNLTSEEIMKITSKDKNLESLIASIGVDGGVLVGWIYENLYIVGCEEPALGDRALILSDEMLYKKLLIECLKINLKPEDIDAEKYKGFMGEENVNRLKQDLTKNFKADNLEQELKKLREEFKESQRQRSLNALKYAMQNTDMLYEKGKISNKNLAIVIGASHIEDYAEIIKQASEGKAGYNLIIITPKNLREDKY